MSLLVRRYRECPELGWSAVEVLDQPVAHVLAHRSTWGDASLVALHNLSAEPVTVPLTLPDLGTDVRLVDLLEDGSTPCGDDGSLEVALPGYGYRWMRVVQPGSRRIV